MNQAFIVALKKLSTITVEECRNICWELSEINPQLMCKISQIVLDTPVTMKRAYQASIRKLRGLTDNDARLIAYILAAHNPRIFCEILSLPTNPNWINIQAKYPGLTITKDFVIQVRQAQMESQSQGIFTGKLSAIKKIRELTGLGLKDAKDFFEMELDKL